MYANGQGVRHDYAEAMAWYRKAAEQGHAAAQYSLGLGYAMATASRTTLPRRWVVPQSRRAGSRSSPVHPRVMYSHSMPLRTMPAEAMRWYRKAADQGYATAQYSVGLGYRDGDGVPQDIAEAMAWFHKAADQAGGAQYSLGSPTATARASRRAIPWR